MEAIKVTERTIEPWVSPGQRTRVGESPGLGVAGGSGRRETWS